MDMRERPTKASTCQHKSLKELTEKYPDQFDKICSFNSTAKLILKESANPFIKPSTKM